MRQARYDAADYAAAAALGKQALQADPFAVSAALHAVNGYLLADRMPDAVEMLKAVRARGDSASVETANRMLKELAAARHKRRRNSKLPRRRLRRSRSCSPKPVSASPTWMPASATWPLIRWT